MFDRLTTRGWDEHNDISLESNNKMEFTNMAEKTNSIQDNSIDYNVEVFVAGSRLIN